MKSKSKRGPKADTDALALAKLIFREQRALEPRQVRNGLALMAEQDRPKGILRAIEKVRSMTDAKAGAFFVRLGKMISRGQHREHGQDLFTLEVERAARQGTVNASEFYYEGRVADATKVGRSLKALGRQPGRQKKGSAN